MKGDPTRLCLRDLAETAISAVRECQQRPFDVSNKDTHLRTVAAAVVETVHAPPAITFLHELHFQIPTAWRFTESCSIEPYEFPPIQHVACAKTNLAAEGAGVPCVLGDFHLLKQPRSGRVRLQ